jgi:beta-galactosidase
VEYKKVIEPVRIEGDAGQGVVTVTNGHDFADLSGLAFRWVYEAGGERGGAGRLKVPDLAPGESARVELPPVPAAVEAGEAFWTVRAVLAEDTAWAPAGHEVAWTQFPAAAGAEGGDAAAARPGAGHAPRRVEGGMIVLGPGTFDAASGALKYLRRNVVKDLALDVWRAPVDNDRGMDWHPDSQLERRWRELGLHRMRHRVERVTTGDGTLTVVTRVAPAAADVALRTVYSWTASGDRLRLEVNVAPEGDWPVPLPRLGVRMRVCPTLRDVTWFGGGPGEAYPDTRAASRIGRWTSTVDALQTPYVRPQENGARADVRWAEVRREDGSGLRVEGEPEFWFTARPWSTAELDAAEHTHRLRRSGALWLHLDHGLHGVGSAACGPEVLPDFRLTAAPAAFSFTFTALAGDGRPFG